MGQRRRTIMLVLAGLLAIGALAFALVPFRDTLGLPGETPDSFSMSCGAPVVAAVHGKSVARLGGVERVVTQYERRILAREPDRVTLVCRRPARGRLLLSIVGLAGAAMALIFVRRRSRGEIPEETTPEATSVAV